MMLVWAGEYSAAPCPSRRRGAPAEERRLSRAKGTSPSCASLIGFPALRDSTREISSARPSSASAIFQRKAARSPGLRCDQAAKTRRGAHSPVPIFLPRRGDAGDDFLRGGVDHIRPRLRRGFHPCPADEHLVTHHASPSPDEILTRVPVVAARG